MFTIWILYRKGLTTQRASQVVYLLKLEDIFALKKAIKKENKKANLKRNAFPNLL